MLINLLFSVKLEKKRGSISFFVTANHEGVKCYSAGSLHPRQDPPTYHRRLRMEGFGATFLN